MKTKILAMFFLLPLFCSAQITMDDDCFDRSNRIFAKVILEVLIQASSIKWWIMVNVFSLC